MQTVITVLVLLLVVAVSSTAIRIIPFAVPLPLVQIALGALLAAPSLGLHVTFVPEVFLLLFIPPLLFADGWRMPKRELVHYRGPILLLALGLVFFTVAGLGYFIDWLVPAIPLSVAFALAAVLSPTDAVALSGIVPRGRMPQQLKHILEGEALLNDASGLVAFKFAVAATLTGVFSFWSASSSFFVVSLGGVVLGIAITWPFNWLRQRIARLSEDDDPGVQIILITLLPFAAYILAEHIGVSGILAAVAAGMAMNFTTDLGSESIATRMRGASVWAMIEMIFNGFVFILLGLQFPSIIGRALVDAHNLQDGELGALVTNVLAVYAALIGLRMVWVWLLRWVSSRRIAGQGVNSALPGFRIAAITSLAGVRGAITLAAVLSVPLTMLDGSPFPARDLIVFIAAGVIICSLLVATVGLPLLLRQSKDVGQEHEKREEREARTAIANAALTAIEIECQAMTHDGGRDDAEVVSEIARQVALVYQRPLHSESDDLLEEGSARRRAENAASIARHLHVTALRAERAELFRRRASNVINDETLTRLLRETDLAESAVLSRGGKSHAAEKKL
ncbi:Na+/H+ antiporter [Caballeronia sp. dw_19]|uniref:Na+/H+ antiporter n=1 Tax=Caballeronia sp. dw_19 TaxID=2719791 RepID=UPI001BD52974|nr:Na+/H+ antiporter [Caballeronia sp. dw_19]